MGFTVVEEETMVDQGRGSVEGSDQGTEGRVEDVRGEVSLWFC